MPPGPHETFSPLCPPSLSGLALSPRFRQPRGTSHSVQLGGEEVRKDPTGDTDFHRAVENTPPGAVWAGAPMHLPPRGLLLCSRCCHAGICTWVSAAEGDETRAAACTTRPRSSTCGRSRLYECFRCSSATSEKAT